jgi:uncharacterized protein YeaO (DUF488 family)
MPVKTKRWDEPRQADDGQRILITRFRPRALPKSEETWDVWRKELAPSAERVKGYRDQQNSALTWEVYRAQYLREMKSHRPEIRELAERVRQGETITLLCSASCLRESRCHRSLLKMLIDQEAGMV